MWQVQEKKRLMVNWRLALLIPGLTWKLSGGEVHVTDVSNASRTMLLNIHTCEWDEELLKLFDIPESLLPEVKPSQQGIWCNRKFCS